MFSFDTLNVLTFVYFAFVVILILFGMYYFISHRMIYSLFGVLVGVLGAIFFIYNKTVGFFVLLIGVVLQLLLRMKKKCTNCGKYDPKYYKKGEYFCNRRCFDEWKAKQHEDILEHEKINCLRSSLFKLLGEVYFFASDGESDLLRYIGDAIARLV